MMGKNIIPKNIYIHFLKKKIIRFVNVEIDPSLQYVS